MLQLIVSEGLSQVSAIVTRANGELNTVGGTIHTIGSEYQALGRGQRFGVSGEGTPTDEADRNKNQSDAFREDRGGTTTPLLRSWPSFRDDAAGPLAGLPFDKGVGDPTVISSFNSVVPQVNLPDPAPQSGPAPMPVTPPMSIVPPQNFTAFGPASDAPSVRVYTPLSGDEFLPR